MVAVESIIGSVRCLNNAKEVGRTIPTNGKAPAEVASVRKTAGLATNGALAAVTIFRETARIGKARNRLDQELQSYKAQIVVSWKRDVSGPPNLSERRCLEVLNASRHL